MTVSGDDFVGRRSANGAWRPRNGAERNTRRAEDVLRRADALYTREMRHGVNEEVRHSAEYVAFRQDAERSTPLEPTPYRDNELTAQGFNSTAEYPYHAIDRTPLYFSRRYEHPQIPNGKLFKQGRYDANSPTGIAADAGLIKIPYKWPELAAADPAKTVYWCEGEKDVETCIRRGLVATTAAGQQLSPVIAKALAGRHLVVLVDNDTKGEENARRRLRRFATMRRASASCACRDCSAVRM
ncbi:hypothetical protein [Bradyrhizobium sp. JYMT SZCCT0428]|uniref:hypothetical protein n=1 Tax=Bradyrhizobium sp. JYMT SZCCT0428 TaxID=2807673 RepID=UPI001BABB574|nr:hypothetical protein [Bradyrhizobium sp. JYMT SZCCT0428]MBR1157199.1 hypothetical protein [Bradyrhizobium sp. JYMT SZCCT0428]